MTDLERVNVLEVDLFAALESIAVWLPFKGNFVWAVAKTTLLELEPLTQSVSANVLLLADKLELGDGIAFSTDNTSLLQLHFVLVSHLIVSRESLVICLEEVREVADVYVSRWICTRCNGTWPLTISEQSVAFWNLVCIICSQNRLLCAN